MNLLCQCALWFVEEFQPWITIPFLFIKVNPHKDTFIRGLVMPQCAPANQGLSYWCVEDVISKSWDHWRNPNMLFDSQPCTMYPPLSSLGHARSSGLINFYSPTACEGWVYGGAQSQLPMLIAWHSRIRWCLLQTQVSIPKNQSPAQICHASSHYPGPWALPRASLTNFQQPTNQQNYNLGALWAPEALILLIQRVHKLVQSQS